MAQCPICKSAAEEIDRGFFDGVGFDCRRHGRFRVTGTVIKLMEGDYWQRSRELPMAKDSKITSPSPAQKSTDPRTSSAL